MADAQYRAVELKSRRTAGLEDLVDDGDRGRVGPPILDDGIDHLAQRVPNPTNEREVLGRPSLRAGGVDEVVFDEPGRCICGLVEVVLELAGYELPRVEKVDGGLEIEVVLVVELVAFCHVANHPTRLDGLGAIG